MALMVVENTVILDHFKPKLEETKKHPERSSYIFFKKIPHYANFLYLPKKRFMLRKSLFIAFWKYFSILILQKIFTSFTTTLMLVFFFFFKNTSISLRSTSRFLLFLLEKYFGTFHVLLFEVFLCFIRNRYLSFLSREKKLRNIF